MHGTAYTDIENEPLPVDHVNHMDACRMTDDDQDRIVKGMLANADVLVTIFVQSRSHFLSSLVPALQKLLASFPILAKSISKAVFMQRLVDRLDHGNVMVGIMNSEHANGFHQVCVCVSV
jgi:hypothetical protein